MQLTGLLVMALRATVALLAGLRWALLKIT